MKSEKKINALKEFIEQTLLDEFSWVDSMLISDTGGIDDIAHREKLAVDQLTAMHDVDVDHGMASHLVDAMQDDDDSDDRTVPKQPYEITYMIQDPSGDLSMVFPKKANITRF